MESFENSLLLGTKICAEYLVARWLAKRICTDMTGNCEMEYRIRTAAPGSKGRAQG